MLMMLMYICLLKNWPANVTIQCIRLCTTTAFEGNDAAIDRDEVLFAGIISRLLLFYLATFVEFM